MGGALAIFSRRSLYWKSKLAEKHLMRMFQNGKKFSEILIDDNQQVAPQKEIRSWI